MLKRTEAAKHTSETHKSMRLKTVQAKVDGSLGPRDFGWAFIATRENTEYTRCG